MRFAFLILFLLLNKFSFAQSAFERHYTFNTWTRGNTVLEIPGQGYFIIGTNDSLAFDSAGIPLSDYYQGIIVKLDFNGDTLKTFQIGNEDTLYTHLFGNNSDDFFRTAMVMDDGNILVAGETQSYNAQNYYDYDLWLLKFNTNLDLLWLKTFSIPDVQLTMAYAQGNKLNKGGMVIPGGSSNFFSWNHQFSLSAFDSLGNVLFSRALLPHLSGELLGAVETDDGGFITTGMLYNVLANSDLSPIVIKTDSNGIEQWHRILPYSGDMHQAHDVARTYDGNYIFNWGNVVRNPGARYKVWMTHITKIDIQGNEIWTKNYGYSFDFGRRLKPLNNGRFIESGWYADTLGNGKQTILMLCDANGDSLWTRKFNGVQGPAPGGGYTKCMDANQTSDGGFILTGETYCCNFTPGLGWTSSLWVLKTDSLGLITSVIDMEKPKLDGVYMDLPYPNPATEFCNVNTMIPPGNYLNAGSEAYLHLFDIRGKELAIIKVGIGLNLTRIDLSEYANGEYLIALSLDGFNAGTKKILLQR